MFETFDFGTLLTLRIGEVTLGPIDTLVLVLALAAALLSAFYLWQIGQGEDRRDRLSARLGSVIESAPTVRPQGPRWYDWIGRSVAASPAVSKSQQEKMLAALAAAGIRGHRDLATFISSKLCAAVAFAALSWLFLEWRHWFQGVAPIRWAVVVAALLLGWQFPNLILSRLAARRRQRIEQGIPDALDLLVICAEAGLSLDQAMEEVGQDLGPANPAVAEEFAATAAELRVLPDRGAALENLVRRTGLESLRGITATLSQAIRFGTPLADSLRVLAAEMRTIRLARLEERAARLPVLLAFPLMAFILPALFMVIGTPTVLRVVDFFKTMIVMTPAGMP